MAQKDKIKELVGRGLDSYHTKSLQQIDRIEKKNKEQFSHLVAWVQQNYPRILELLLHNQHQIPA